MKNQRNNSSYSVDYNQLMIELRKARKNYEASTNYTDLMRLKHFCEKNGFTAQRIYLCKSNPTLGVNTINKLVTAGTNIIVSWDDECSGFTPFTAPGIGGYERDNEKADRIEVIGNIYENK